MPAPQVAGSRLYRSHGRFDAAAITLRRRIVLAFARASRVYWVRVSRVWNTLGYSLSFSPPS